MRFWREEEERERLAWVVRGSVPFCVTESGTEPAEGKAGERLAV